MDRIKALSMMTRAERAADRAARWWLLIGGEPAQKKAKTEAQAKEGHPDKPIDDYDYVEDMAACAKQEVVPEEDCRSKAACAALGICNRWLSQKICGYPTVSDVWIFGPIGHEVFPGQ
jgi:hypothetical protein